MQLGHYYGPAPSSAELGIVKQTAPNSVTPKSRKVLDFVRGLLLPDLCHIHKTPMYTRTYPFMEFNTVEVSLQCEKK